ITGPQFRDQVPSDQERREPMGTLRLDVQPSRVAQLYVDGFYLGMLDEVNGELTLEAGARRIEIRAPGYETMALDVKVVPGRAITYRGALVPLEAAAAEPTSRPVEVTPAASKPVYFIPGCYMGNIPPKDAGLPATCDQSRVTTFQR
ncbi:MAG: PEGA domain-containing protein, partial [Acidobacteria bacterium]|nr:PEGA domain-containing protein [Acidobacteriota bacterium]